MSEREENLAVVRGIYTVLANGVPREPRSNPQPQRKRRRRSKAARERAYHQSVHTTIVYVGGFPYRQHADGTREAI